MSDRVNVLLVGGGGREHSLAWKLRQSARLGDLWVSNPENPGLVALGKPLPDVPVDSSKPFQLQRFCDRERIGLVVIGPEEPLAAGLADVLQAEGRVVFGASKDAARLEADKSWCRQVMHAASVPMAEGRSFTDPDAAKRFLESREIPYVVKAAGLCKGKGVVVPATMAEAIEAVDQIMVKRVFGDAGKTVVIEERIKGQEVSVLSLVDGRNIFVLEPCQDHKRLGDGDTGPNTGGMGVFSPGGGLDEEMLGRIEREVLVPTVDTLRRDGVEYQGVLYAGLMITPGGPKVLEFNCRFGDPECQALMVRLEADLVEVMLATGRKRLHEVEIGWKAGSSCCVVLASRGYPEKPETGKVIEGLEEAAAVEGVQVFHAGTRAEGGRIVTKGGRVLNVVGTGADLMEARGRAYRACEMIRFEGKTCRTDIGAVPVVVA